MSYTAAEDVTPAPSSSFLPATSQQASAGLAASSFHAGGGYCPDGGKGKMTTHEAAAAVGVGREQQLPREGGGGGLRSEDAGSSSTTAGASSSTQDRRNPLKRKANSNSATLSVLLQALVGNQVLVELKNDTEINGYLQDADSAMNLVMCDVRSINKQGVAQDLAMLYVSGRMIRYVHISEHVDIGRTLQRHVKAIDSASRRAKQRPEMKARPAPTPSAPIVVRAAERPTAEEVDEEEEDDEDDNDGK